MHDGIRSQIKKEIKENDKVMERHCAIGVSRHRVEVRCAKVME